MTMMSIRDVSSIHVEIMGEGYPLGADARRTQRRPLTLLPFRRCADRFTLVFYDHRCNGRSEGLRWSP